MVDRCGGGLADCVYGSAVTLFWKDDENVEDGISFWRYPTACKKLFQFFFNFLGWSCLELCLYT
jgi:hypothetical protein